MKQHSRPPMNPNVLPRLSPAELSESDGFRRRDTRHRAFGPRLALVTASLAVVLWVSWPSPAPGNPRAPAQPRASAGAELVSRGRELEQAGQPQAAGQFYRQAMLEGADEGAYRLATLEWNQAAHLRGRAQLRKERLALGLWFQAATNRHAAACLRLAECFREGRAVDADPVRAYAWLRLALAFDPEIPLARLDELALEMTPAQIKRAQEIARDYQAGRWPAAIAPALVENDPRWRLTGVITGTRATIKVNRVTLAAGDSAHIEPWTPPGARPVAVTCIAIGADFALLAVADEPDRVLLALDAH